MLANLLAFITAFLVCTALVPWVRKLAVRMELLDLPGPRKVHSRPTPLLGGLAVFVAASLGLVLFIEPRHYAEASAILAGGMLLATVGVLDDRGWLHHQVKLLVAMPVAAILLVASGITTVYPLALLLPRSSTLVVALAAVATCLFVIAVTASFSILDHMDGLCAGMSAIAGAYFFMLAVMNGQHLVAVLAAAITGAGLGFLFWNLRPATIFMGDGGAMFFGFIMAVLAIKLRFVGMTPAKSWMIPVLVLLGPLFDTALVTVSRLRRGLVPFASPGKDHLAHRLVAVGLDPRGAVLVVYTVGILGGLLALAAAKLSVREAYGLLAAVVVIAGIAIAVLERVQFEKQAGRRRIPA